VISVDDGSAGRILSCLYHLSIVLTAATFGGESMTGAAPEANTWPPNAFMSAAWKKKFEYSYASPKRPVEASVMPLASLTSSAVVFGGVFTSAVL